MKKLILSVFTAVLLMAVLPAPAIAGTAPNTVTMTAPVISESAEAQAMLTRLNEIKAMDLNSLSSAKRKQLRQEVKAMKSQMRASDGIYLSVGAIVIIALLLILLL